MHPIQPRARRFDNLNVALRCQGENLSEPAFHLGTFGKLDLEHIPTLGAQGFVDGVSGVDEFFHTPIISDSHLYP